MSVGSVLTRGAPAATGGTSVTGPRDAGVAVHKVDLPFRGETRSIWDQVNDLLSAPFKDSIDSVGEADTFESPPEERRVVVASGIVVGAEEYEIRYAQLDLEGLRSKLSPELFRAFVRHIGVVRGWEDLDVAFVAEIPE